MPTIETVPYRGWKRNVRLTNGQVELIVTQEVGPRIVRFGFVGGDNIFGELPEQMGGSDEEQWMIRGGHRLWIAPEEVPKTYELDNAPIEIRGFPGGIRAVQPPGPLTGVQKTMDISLSDSRNEVTVVHRLANKGRHVVSLAPWALTVMAKRGLAIIPLPKKLPHTALLTHNQNWSLWGYTDLGDPRWTILPRYLLFRQDPRRGPNKLGIAHCEGWAGYLRNGLLFVKRFERIPDAAYPDGNVNFETFANERILELETLGPLAKLRPGQTTAHKEIWTLHRGIKACRTEAEIDRCVATLTKNKFQIPSSKFHGNEDKTAK